MIEWSHAPKLPSSRYFLINGVFCGLSGGFRKSFPKDPKFLVSIILGRKCFGGDWKKVSFGVKQSFQTFQGVESVQGEHELRLLLTRAKKKREQGVFNPLDFCLTAKKPFSLSSTLTRF